MSNNPSRPFSNGTEYEWFRYQFCERCLNYKENEKGFPEYPDKGGCPVLDAMENARFDISQFPSEDIRELTNAKTGDKIAWHYCRKFHNSDYEGVMVPYFTMMSKALFPDWEEKHGGKQ